MASIREAKLRERARISRLLHDELGQVLSAAGLQMDLARMDCQQVPGVGERIAEAQKLLERALAQVRDLSYDLSPAIVERLGLEAALARLVARQRARFPGELEWSYRGESQLRGAQAEALYRVAEQALENAVEHSGARRINLSVEIARQTIKLEVRDDGKGFTGAKVLRETPAIGLRLMKLEAEEAGMEFRLASGPQGGTIVTVVWPPRAEAGKAGKRRRAGGNGQGEKVGP